MSGSRWAGSARPWTTPSPTAFNSIIKVEYTHRHRFRIRAEARLKIVTWIVDFYNIRRRHSAGDGAPIGYERLLPNRPLNSANRSGAACSGGAV